MENFLSEYFVINPIVWELCIVLLILIGLRIIKRSRWFLQIIFHLKLKTLLKIYTDSVREELVDIISEMESSDTSPMKLLVPIDIQDCHPEGSKLLNWGNIELSSAEFEPKVTPNEELIIFTFKKSLFLKPRMAINWLFILLNKSKNSKDDIRIPIILNWARIADYYKKLRSISLANIPEIEIKKLQLSDYLEQELKNQGIAIFTQQFLKYWMRQGKCVIFLYGFDQNTLANYIDWLSPQLKRFVKQENKVIISAQSSNLRSSFASTKIASDKTKFFVDIGLIVENLYIQSIGSKLQNTLHEYKEYSDQQIANQFVSIVDNSSIGSILNTSEKDLKNIATNAALADFSSIVTEVSPLTIILGELEHINTVFMLRLTRAIAEESKKTRERFVVPFYLPWDHIVKYDSQLNQEKQEYVSSEFGRLAQYLKSCLNDLGIPTFEMDFFYHLIKAGDCVIFIDKMEADLYQSEYSSFFIPLKKILQYGNKVVLSVHTQTYRSTLNSFVAMLVRDVEIATENIRIFAHRWIIKDTIYLNGIYQNLLPLTASQIAGVNNRFLPISFQELLVYFQEQKLVNFQELINRATSLERSLFSDKGGCSIVFREPASSKRDSLLPKICKFWSLG